MSPMTDRLSDSISYDWIGLGTLLLGPLTYMWQDPRFEFSVPPYADRRNLGCARFILPGGNCWYWDLSRMLVSALKSILQSALTCFSCDPNDKETFN